MNRFSKVRITAAVRNPQAVARLSLVFVASLLVALLALMGMSSGPDGALVLAQASPTPTGEPEPTGPAIELINPTSGYDVFSRPDDNVPEVSDKSDGIDEQYHIVALTRGAGPNTVVEAYLTPRLAGTDLQEQTIGTLEPVAGTTDTWEFYWDVPEPPAASEGEARITVRMFDLVGGVFEEVAMDDELVQMRQSETAQPPSGDGQPAAETVELTWPTQGGPLGFYKPKGGVWTTAIDGSASQGNFSIALFYTKNRPGSEAKWTRCALTGSTSRVRGPFRIQCPLAGKDLPSEVTAISAVAIENQNKGSSGSTAVRKEESQDAHRVLPYVQDPDEMSVDLNTSPVGDDVFFELPEGRVEAGKECLGYLATVTDLLERPVVGANLDIHMAGPTDQLRFGDFDLLQEDEIFGDVTSASKVPDKGSHSRENGYDCDDRDEDLNQRGQRPEREQGDHNRPGQADEKHVESIEGVGLDGEASGKYLFHLYSQDVGFTDITVWVDDEGIATETETRPADTDLLEAGEPTDSSRAQWLPGPARLSFDPVSDTAPAGTCNQYILKARGGNAVIPGVNVDVHATGPTDELDFCDPGDGTARRAPDDRDAADEDRHDPEDAGESSDKGASPKTQHTEGETDDKGNFVVGIISPVPGDTTLEAWIDGEPENDDDVQDDNEVSASATHSWASSSGDAEVRFVNPSGYGGSGDTVSNKQDADNRYHIVTRVDAPDVISGVEIFISSDGSTFTKIGDATRVQTSDTYEMFWDVTVPDGDYTLRAQIAGTGQREDRAITVNNSSTANNPQDAPSETAELTRPLNVERAPFSKGATTVSGQASAGAERVRFFYTKTAAKDVRNEDEWIQCGQLDLGSNKSFSGKCALQDPDEDGANDQPFQVTGIAVVAVDCVAPAGGCTPPESPQNESGDAHRVFGFDAEPLVSIEPAETQAEPGTCQKFVMSITDQTGQSLSGVNADLHLTGPTDGATFCDVERGTPREAPTEGGHTATTNSTQSHHQQDGADTVHTEAVSSPGGEVVVGIRSGSEGDSSLLGWADLNDNDELDVDERSDSALMHWRTGSGSGGRGGGSPCSISGDSGNNVLRGTPGDDVICGFGGADRLVGRGGDDVLKGGGGRDIIRGAGGADVLRGGGGPDRLRAGSGNDRLHGNAGNDFMNGQAGRDTCRGGRGRDNAENCER